MNNLPLFHPVTPIEDRYSENAQIVLASGDVNEFIVQIPDNSIALVITSPPYNLGKEYEDRVSIKRYLHPCQFPIELVERCVLALTNEGDQVFDPYMGVGSSLIAAVMHNRRAIGCEKEAEYAAIARQRLVDYFDGTLRHRPLGRPVHQPSGTEKVSQVPEEWKDAPQARLLERKSGYE